MCSGGKAAGAGSHKPGGRKKKKKKVDKVRHLLEKQERQAAFSRRTCSDQCEAGKAGFYATDKKMKCFNGTMQANQCEVSGTLEIVLL